MKTTILLPCLNEENTILNTYEALKKVIDKNKIDACILVCDNNSTDSTHKILKKNKIDYIIEEEKGYGSTLINGINHIKTPYAIMLDSDMSYDEEDIPKIIELLKTYDLVVGNRFKGKCEKGAMPFIHRIGSSILTKIANLRFKTPINDYHCGLRGFNVKKIKKLNLNTKGMEFASEMIIKAKLNNLSMIEFPTNYRKDKRGHKGHLRTFRDGFRHLHLIIHTR